MSRLHRTLSGVTVVSALMLIAALVGGCGGGGTPDPGDVQGLVIDARSGEGILAAEVAVVGTEIVTSCTASGDYWLRDVPSGRVTLRVTTPEGLSQTAVVSVPPGGAARKHFSFYGDETVKFGARVIDFSTAEGVVGAQVSLDSFSGTTDGDGRVVITDVRPGSNTLQIVAAGYETCNMSVLCIEEAEIVWGLVPILSAVDDQSFHSFSERTMTAALALSEYLNALESLSPALGAVDVASRTLPASQQKNIAEETSTLAAAVVAADTLGSLLEVMAAYEGETVQSTADKGLFDWLTLGLRGARFSRGADETFSLKQRVLSGEDVPEIDAWLRANPYAGYTSLAQIRADSDIFGNVLLEKVVATYILTHENSPFLNDVVEPGRDIVIGSYTGGASNLLGDGLNSLWSGFGTILTEFADAWSFISEFGHQYIWGIDRASGQVVLLQTRPGEPAEFPSGSFNLAISNGVLLGPTLLSEFSVAPGATRTVVCDAEIASRLSIGVTPAGFDDFGSLLTQIGLSWQEISVSRVAEGQMLSDFDVVCVNCAGDWNEFTYSNDAAERIRGFVEDGGTLYASDWAYVLVRDAFGDMVSFFDAPYCGYEQNVEARIQDPGLAAYLNKSGITINYDLGGWVPIKTVDPDVRIDIRGPIAGIDESSGAYAAGVHARRYSSPQPMQSDEVQDLPLSVTFTYGAGRVHYTSFHNEAQASDDMRRILLYSVLTD